MFSIWRACERLGILPTGVKPQWEDIDLITQARILAFDSVREYEEIELLQAQMGVKAAAGH